uniref:LTD domain-containing protein n=1 Tax=Plectus sambesii TaxID=2011161 RepID=A0A914WL67_9BILA
MTKTENENQVSQSPTLSSRTSSPFNNSSSTRTSNSSSNNFRSEIKIESHANGTSASFGARTYHSGKGSYAIGSGLLSSGGDGAMFIRRTRERDNKDFAELNDTFANYIENVRFLAAQNQSLTKEYDLLTIGLSEDVKSLEGVYTSRLQKAEDLVKGTNRQKMEIEIEIGKQRQELDAIRKKYEDALNIHKSTENEIDVTLVQLSTVESEIALFKRRIEILEMTTTARLNREKDRIRSELERANIALEQATQECADHRSHLQKYVAETEKITNHNKTHDKAFIGMQIRMLRGMSPEDREFFKRELAKAIREIRAKCEYVNEQHRTEMESKYWALVQEMQKDAIEDHKKQEIRLMEVNELEISLNSYQKKFSEINSQKSLLMSQESDQKYAQSEYERLYKAEVQDRLTEYHTLEEECAALKKQLDSLPTMDDLKREIKRYSSILESEESRVDRRQHAHAEARYSRENDASVTTIKQKNAKGMQVAEIEHDASRGDVLIREDTIGRYIILENTDTSNEKALSEWVLKRHVDNNPEIVFQLPKDFVLKPGKSVKIWARNKGGANNPPDELIWNDGDSFGMGSNVKTILTDRDGNVRATRNRGFDKKQIGCDSVMV